MSLCTTVQKNPGKRRKVRISALVLTFLLGLIGFSSLSRILTVNLLRLPIYFPEPFFTALFLMVYFGASRQFRPRQTPKLIIIVVSFLFVWLFLVMLAINESTFYEIISTARPYLYAFLAAVLAGCLRGQNEEYVFVFLVGIAVGEMIGMKLVPVFDANYRGISSVNLIAVYALASLAVLSQRTQWIVLALLLLVPMVLMSGFRAAVAVFLLSLLTAYAIRAIGSIRTNVIKTIVMLVKFAGVIGSVIFLGYFFVTHIYDLHPFAYFRVVNRSLGLLTGDLSVSQDEERIAKLIYYITQEPGGILPTGFVMRGRDAVGNFNDVPFLNFTVTFGVPLGLAIIIVILTVGLVYAAKIIMAFNSSPIDLTAAAFFPCLVFLLLINGRFAYILYESVLWGGFVGYWFWSFGYRKQKNKRGLTFHEH